MNTSATFKVPTTKNQLVTQGNQIGRAIEKGQWSRAAMVYAWCAPGRNQHVLICSSANGQAPRLTFSEFAALRIFGLRKRQTVSQYWHAWESARVDGVVNGGILAGEEVSLPEEDEADWQTYYDSGAKAAAQPSSEQVAAGEIPEPENAEETTELEQEPEPANPFLAALGDLYRTAKDIEKLSGAVADMTLNENDAVKLVCDIQALIDALSLLRSGIASIR
ncbi:hypothetical protein [Rhodococcus marinonascens]|uniref:hypothetical protein n=1 Tax=Rhodococcus marinonascens TaxID=38311 RepID=UPI0009324067|nr:hypothetical protein [Rhodococcus marinonascens]